MDRWRNAQYDRQRHSLEAAAAADVLLDDVHRAEIAYIPTLTTPFLVCDFNLISCGSQREAQRTELHADECPESQCRILSLPRESVRAV